MLKDFLILIIQWGYQSVYISITTFNNNIRHVSIYACAIFIVFSLYFQA
jgi:hypothetical protein